MSNGERLDFKGKTRLRIFVEWAFLDWNSSCNNLVSLIRYFSEKCDDAYSVLETSNNPKYWHVSSSFLGMAWLLLESI